MHHLVFIFFRLRGTQKQHKSPVHMQTYTFASSIVGSVNMFRSMLQPAYSTHECNINEKNNNFVIIIFFILSLSLSFSLTPPSSPSPCFFFLHIGPLTSRAFECNETFEWYRRTRKNNNTTANNNNNPSRYNDTYEME